MLFFTIYFSLFSPFILFPFHCLSLCEPNYFFWSLSVSIFTLLLFYLSTYFSLLYWLSFFLSFAFSLSHILTHLLLSHYFTWFFLSLSLILFLFVPICVVSFQFLSFICVFLTYIFDVSLLSLYLLLLSLTSILLPYLYSSFYISLNPIISTGPFLCLPLVYHLLSIPMCFFYHFSSSIYLHICVFFILIFYLSLLTLSLFPPLYSSLPTLSLFQPFLLVLFYVWL